MKDIQGDFESCADILITSYWLHVGTTRKKYLKNSMSKNKMTFIFLTTTTHWRTFYKT
jgi:hypothetical protein